MEIIDFRTRPRTAYYYRQIHPKPIPEVELYFKVYHMEGQMGLTSLEESVAEMQAAGISKGVVFSGDFEHCKQVYEDCKKFPDTLIPMTEIDISQGVLKSKRELEYAFKEYDFKGMTLSPFISGVYPTDSRLFPLYALCEEMGKPVHVHSSTHFNPKQPLDISDPMQIDRLAVHFPELNWVIGHAGMGFGLTGIVIAQRLPNVYIDFTGLRPRYLPKEMLHAINTFLAKKAIYGSNYPSLPHDIAEEWKEVVRENVQPYFFGKNASRILGLDK